MKVRSGWNSEFARKKYDVEMDEADIARLLREHGLPVDLEMTATEAHSLLYTSAEMLALRELVKFDPSMKDDNDVRARMVADKQEKAALLEKLKERVSG